MYFSASSYVTKRGIIYAEVSKLLAMC